MSVSTESHLIDEYPDRYKTFLDDIDDPFDCEKDDPIEFFIKEENVPYYFAGYIAFMSCFIYFINKAQDI